ncbi:MAG: MATE family efflux transporter [Eubacterium aggregans]|uniref:Probable multidrug resistance protein NorM n=1 Tax=Eubacterium aggregans TaxID=81409 RepID=A0A1H4A408_9FIRM|nr:MATE family efflux transporter [Eubacterium aggregans]MEA5074273.1 MATE family efflux transporter [Eubacterium aggregans]SEA30381.1 putative efflux protein, MATE family [Eubacterium aggregans]
MEKGYSRENKMGEMPIPKLLVSMALPAIISMFVQAMYNVVDSIFVAQVSENALTAVSLAFPVQMVIVSCFVGMGVGINSGISRRLGEGRHKDAEQVAEHGFLIAIILSVILAVLGGLFSNGFVTLFTDNQEIIAGCTSYLMICCVFCFGSIITQAGFSMLQGSGDMIQPMIGQLIGAVVNIVLDPIMIFGLLGFPAMGVTGAAIATVAGQIVAMIYVLCVVAFRKKNILKVHIRGFKFDGTIMKDIIAVGLPAAVMQGIASFMVTFYNLILTQYGTTAIAVFGVFFKVQSFIFMPVFGLCQGAMPIYGYNYGARKADRFLQNAKVACIISECIMILGVVLFQFFPEQIFRMFNASDDMMVLGVQCFRVISWSFVTAGISIPLSNAFQAVGKAYISMFSSFLRQMILLLPFSWLFSYLWGVDWIWMGFVVSDVLNLIYVGVMFVRLKRKELDTWGQHKGMLSAQG